MSHEAYIRDGAKNGDEEMIDQLVRLYYKAAYKIAHRWAKSGKIEESEALSLANIAIMKCVRNGNYDETKKTKYVTYLCTAVHNEIRMFLRKEKRYRKKILYSIDEPVISEHDHFGDGMDYANASEMASPGTVEEEVEERMTLEEAVSVLNEAEKYMTRPERIALIMHLNGRSVRDISKKLDCSDTYSRSSLNKAKEKLKEFSHGTV